LSSLKENKTYGVAFGIVLPGMAWPNRARSAVCTLAAATLVVAPVGGGIGGVVDACGFRGSVGGVRDLGASVQEQKTGYLSFLLSLENREWVTKRRLCDFK
jgi:hypothetical protein